MPYWFETKKIKLPRKYDRRIKLTNDDKTRIKKLYKSGNYSKRGLARKFNVDPQTIRYILHPERKEKARLQYKERRKDGRYYNKEKHTMAMGKTRKYKSKILKKE